MADHTTTAVAVETFPPQGTKSESGSDLIPTLDMLSDLERMSVVAEPSTDLEGTKRDEWINYDLDIHDHLTGLVIEERWLIGRAMARRHSEFARGLWEAHVRAVYKMDPHTANNWIVVGEQMTRQEVQDAVAREDTWTDLLTVARRRAGKTAPTTAEPTSKLVSGQPASETPEQPSYVKTASGRIYARKTPQKAPRDPRAEWKSDRLRRAVERLEELAEDLEHQFRTYHPQYHQDQAVKGPLSTATAMLVKLGDYLKLSFGDRQKADQSWASLKLAATK